MQDLKGRTAFVTGGASGIGLGMVQAFLAEGMRVALADVRQDHLDQVRLQLGARQDVHMIRLDVTDRDAFAAAADEAEKRLGPVSILCNNAGVGVLGDVKHTRYADWDWTFAVNLGGVINGIQTFLPRMLGSAGHIVNTSSIGGLLPGPGGIAYLTSKAAVIGLSEALLCDLEGDSIGVTVLIPGPTTTNINQVSALRPPAYADTGVAELEAQLAVAPLFTGGLDPVESGRMVVEAIRANRLYLSTHPEFRDGVAEHFEAILTGFGPPAAAGAPAPVHGVPTHNPMFRKIIAASGADEAKEESCSK